jgi:hypothetical protein
MVAGNLGWMAGSFSNCSKMESLDLSGNNISGEVGPGFLSLE